jgi:tRNA A37 threonylcarbamoyladenosine biosynthesis protein TsaE
MKIFNHFQHINLTNDQRNALEQINTFLTSENNVFILQGYAGSGKTTIISGIADYLTSLKTSYYLMTPTGRAAKILGEKTKKNATTIHRTIYSFSDLKETEISGEENDISYVYYFKVRDNDQINTVFIVDEASMVSDQHNQQEYIRFGSGKLLFDLIEFSRIQNPEANSKIIFVGDPAQLPPVNMNFSPALTQEYLKSEYSLKCEEIEIKEIKRQTENSGILRAASNIRKCLTSGFYNDFDLRGNGKDILNIQAHEFINTYKNFLGSKIIISYKNKTAFALNKRIRQEKYGNIEHLKEGDQIIIGANNYKFNIYNGELGVVSKVGESVISRSVAIKNKGYIGLKWRYVELLLPDNNETKEAKGYILENYLYSENDITTHEKLALYIDFKKRFAESYKAKGLKVPSAKSEDFKEALINDEFYHAILLKYGYAITCHKAQGGEWDNVVTVWDRGSIDNNSFYIKKQSKIGKTNKDFYRWAYTAVTRASKVLYCINPPYFSSLSNLSFVDVNVQNAYNEMTNKSLIPEEINLEGEALAVIRQFGLLNAPIPVQDHFLKIWHITRSQYIDITGWERKGYEIRYYFKRKDDIAAIKFWVNGQSQFKNKFQKLPGSTNSNNFFETLSQVIEKSVLIIINRRNIESVLTKIEFDIDIEESKPFLKILYNKFEKELAQINVTIEDINHHNYRERYTLIRRNEKVVIDLEYDGKGFYGRVLPIESKCNSTKLLSEIILTLKTIQKPDYVI